MNMSKFGFSLYIVLASFVGSAQAESVKIAASLAIPPYVLDGGHSGMEVDIVQKALSKRGHDSSIELYPLKRVYSAVREGRVDAAMTVVPSDEHADLYFSDSHIIYYDVAISLKENSFDIQVMDDLIKYSVLSFQNSTLYLGDEYANVVPKIKNYSEKADQKAQIAMLFSGKVDVIVIDINIFKNFLKTETRVDTSREFVIHELFDKLDTYMVFSSQHLRDEFNQGLKDIKASGEYQKIIQHYVD